MKLNRRQTAILVLLVIGVAACWTLYPRSPALNRGIPSEFSAPGLSAPAKMDADDVLAERILLAVAAVVTLVPFTRQLVSGILERLHAPSLRARRWTALAIFLLSQPLLYVLAIIRGRVLLPYWHDENFYRLQTTFLAHGKLYASGLALSDFFDVPYVFVKPLYAVAYFPGTALLHVPAAWMHLPYFITPLLIAGVTLALLYRIATELMDGVAGLLAVVLMLSLAMFRWMALVEMSHAAGAMWGLVGIWSWLAWRKSRKTRWVVLAALAAGFYAVTRPLDCVLILLPVALAWSWDLRKESWRGRGLTLAIVIGVLTPFISLQLAFDRAITGHLLQTPMGLYYRTYMNLHGIGLEHYDPAFVTPSQSPILRDTYYGVVAPRMRDFSSVRSAAWQWINSRVPVSLGSSLPSLLLIVLVPIGLIAIHERRARILWMALGCWIAGSAFVFQFLDHYVMAIAPLVILFVLVGAAAIPPAFPTRDLAAVFLPLAIFLLAIHRLCLNDQGAYQRLERSVMHWNYVEIPAKVTQPAIVLFRYGSDERNGAFDEEPVYNWDVVNPDVAPIIRAQDLGPERDKEFFDYFAMRQPDRNVYLFDRAHWKLQSLGKVKDLASN